MTDEELAGIIGRKVREARERAGLTQTALSEQTGIAAPNVSRLEAGTHLPSVTTLKRVADTLRVPICSLLEPEGEHAALKKKRAGKAKEK
jgi:transcriptional regulator with XRE-family HTH domain